MKTELITNVSHDLKTPLTSIVNYSELLKTCDLSDPRAVEYTDTILRHAQRLKKLTEDLVDASKAASGSIPVELEPLDLSELVTQAVGEYSDRLEASGLTAVVQIPSLSPVLADSRQLWRVMDNLLSNAAKYAMANTRVFCSAGQVGDKVTLSVKNVSAAPLTVPVDELTERFVRGDSSRHTEGSGLGLSISRSLTELMGGTFCIDTEGDLFKVALTFPAVTPSSQFAAVEAEAREPQPAV